MKKVRVLVVAITVALMVMGIGYAVWTQSLNITVLGDTTKMDVKFTAASAETTPYISTSACVLPGDKIVAASVTKLYPSATGVIHATIKNFSTMPVYMDKITLGHDLALPTVLGNDILVGFNTTGQWVTLNSDAVLPCDVTILPNDSIDFVFQVKLDPASDNDTQKDFFLEGFTFNIEPNFVSNK